MPRAAKKPTTAAKTTARKTTTRKIEVPDPPPGETNPYLTLDEVSAHARTPINTIRHWIRTGRLRSFSPGRRVLVRRSDLTELIEGSARQSA